MTIRLFHHSLLIIIICFIFSNVRMLECEQTKRPVSVHREAPYRTIVFDSEGITLNNMIGFADVNKLVVGGIEKEAESIFEHTNTILERNGVSLDQVYAVHIKLANLEDSEIVDEIFKKYFKEPYPEKTYKQANRLPFDARIEADISATMTLENLFKNKREMDESTQD